MVDKRCYRFAPAFHPSLLVRPHLVLKLVEGPHDLGVYLGALRSVDVLDGASEARHDWLVVADVELRPLISLSLNRPLVSLMPKDPARSEATSRRLLVIMLL